LIFIFILPSNSYI